MSSSCAFPSPIKLLQQRPAVVISKSAYNLSRPDVVMLAITSQLDAVLSAGDVRIAEWQAAGLLKPSAIKPVFATIEQALIVRRLGMLQHTDVSALRTAIALTIGQSFLALSNRAVVLDHDAPQIRAPDPCPIHRAFVLRDEWAKVKDIGYRVVRSSQRRRNPPCPSIWTASHRPSLCAHRYLFPTKS